MKNTVQYKLWNHEVAPPEGIWDKISMALDESELSNEFPATLYEASVTPPKNTWNKIVAQLEAEQTIKNPPAQRRLFPLLKYAAAAVIIGFMVWGGIRLLNNNTGKTELAEENNEKKEKDSIIVSSDQIVSTPDEKISVDENTAPEDEARNDAALEASKKTFAKLDLPVKNRINEIAAGFSFASSVNNIPRLADSGETNAVNLSGRYITLMTPEGNIIRMSKKFSDMVCCVYGEDENKECMEQIKKWQEKIICLPACHSTGGFMDMINLVDALQDN